jgi:hypothetical protein
MGKTSDAPGDYFSGERGQSEKIDEILRLEHDMEEMLSLETGSDDSREGPARTVATNTTK